MTKTHDTLIKLHQHFLDEKRREMVILEESREQIMKAIRKLDIDFITEKQFASKAPEKAYTFIGYIKNYKAKRAKSSAQVNALNVQIDKLAEQISDAFGEMKKYEIMRDKKLAQIERELMHKAQVNLDEMGGIAHQRKQEV